MAAPRTNDSTTRLSPAEPSLSREEKIERLTNALWRTSDEKLDVIAAVIDL